MASIDDTNILSRVGSKEKLIEEESPKQSYGSNEQSQSSPTTDAKKQQNQEEETPPTGPASPSSPPVVPEMDRIEQLSDSSGPKTSQERSISPQVTITQSSGGASEEGRSPREFDGMCRMSCKNLVAFLVGFVCFVLRLVLSAEPAFYEVIVLSVTLMLCSLVSCLVPRGRYAKDLPEYVKPSARRRPRHVSPDLPDDFPMEPRQDLSSPEEPSTEQVHQVDVHHPDLPSSPSTSSAAKGVDPKGGEPRSKISSGGREAAETPSSPSSKTEASGSSFEESEKGIEKDITEAATGYK